MQLLAPAGARRGAAAVMVESVALDVGAALCVIVALVLVVRMKD